MTQKTSYCFSTRVSFDDAYREENGELWLSLKLHAKNLEENFTKLRMLMLIIQGENIYYENHDPYLIVFKGDEKVLEKAAGLGLLEKIKCGHD